ncbi:MAG TPA: DUF2505 family protein [bacterium]|nr:DUF2505 family protein [bacterium]
MKYKVRHVIEGTIQEVFEVGMDRSRDVRVYSNVTKSTVKKREQKGDIINIVVETIANGDIPPKLRKLISPKMLTWTETGKYDLSKNTYDYSVKTFYFTNVFSLTGHFEFEEDGKGNTIRTLDGEIKINIPILGQIAEKKIVEIQKENLELDIKSMREEVKALRESKK